MEPTCGYNEFWNQGLGDKDTSEIEGGVDTIVAHYAQLAVSEFSDELKFSCDSLTNFDNHLQFVYYCIFDIDNF